jgi:hypothetical protein
MQMKKIIGFLFLVLFIGAACYVYVPYDESGRRSPRESTYDRDYGRYDNLDSSYFYNELEPYGMWVSHRPYGYVWIPRYVGYNWRPYTQGHWAWTDYGWTWVSLERWGWIAFHYGRWGWDRRMGWFWVPDVLWGPAWVAWRWGDAHIGWAPLPPGVDFMPGRGYGRQQWDIPGHYWNFVRGRDFLDRSLDRWVLPAERNDTLIIRTNFDVNISERDRRVVNEGLDVEQVRRLTNRTIERSVLKDATRPGADREEGGEVVMSRPVIRRNEAAKPKQVLDESKAERELDSDNSSRVYRRIPRNEEQAVREDHDQERWLMQQSQETEINEIRRKIEDDKARVQNPVEKQKYDEEANSKINEVKKKHDQEKADLAKRQKEEEAKTKRTPIRRKIEKG